MYKSKFPYAHQVIVIGPNDTLYFAYGSNLDPDRMSQRLGGAVEPVCIANLYGYQLTYDAGNPKYASSYANISYTGDMREAVKGVVYKLRSGKIDELDQFEGVHDPITGYARFDTNVTVITPLCKSLWRTTDHTVPVSLGKNSQLKIQVYEAKPTYTCVEAPTRQYLFHVMKGAIHFQFPHRYIEKYIIPERIQIESARNY